MELWATAAVAAAAVWWARLQKGKFQMERIGWAKDNLAWVATPNVRDNAAVWEKVEHPRCTQRSVQIDTPFGPAGVTHYQYWPEPEHKFIHGAMTASWKVEWKDSSIGGHTGRFGVDWEWL